MRAPAAFRSFGRRPAMRLGSRCLPAELLLLLLLPLYAQAATNVVVSSAYRASATAAGNSYAPVISADGNRVIFLSHAANLVTNADPRPHLNLFARDIFSPGNTTLLSVSTNGHSGANASVTRYSIGSIGWFVAFETAASNLTRNDTNGVSDIFLRGTDDLTRLISVNAAGTGPGNGRSFNPLVSRYGERVVFESEATDLVANDTNGVADLFVRDLRTGQTRLVSVNAAGTGPGNGPSSSPFLSEYGGHVAFVSLARDLVEGVTNTLGEVYVRDLNNNTTRWAMAGLTSNSPPCLRLACFGRPDGYVPSDPITFEGGRTVVFKLGGHSVVRWEFSTLANATNDRVYTLGSAQGETLAAGPLLAGFDGGLVSCVVGRTNSSGQITNSWLRRINFNTPVEVVPPPGGQTSFVYLAQNVVSGAPADGQVFGPSMSSDGVRFVFASDSTRLLAQPLDGSTQIYYHEMGAPYSVLLSARTNGAAGPDLNGVIPSSTRWGRSVVWETHDPTVVGDDLNGAYDVVHRDLDQSRTSLISSRHPGLPAVTSLGASRIGPGGLSGNGRMTAFTALDGTFVANDTNHLKDAFTLDLVTGARTRLTVSAANAEPFPPALNADGRFAVFEQTTFTQGTLGVTNSFRADLLSNTMLSVARAFGGGPLPAGHPSMTADGRHVAFHSAEFAPSLAPFGPGDANPAADVFVRDFNPPPTNGPRIDTIVASISRSHGTTGNAESRAPTISPDGRWVAFHSLANDLTYDTFPVQRHQVFAYDRTRNAVKLLSYTPSPFNSNATALSIIATNPVFSADSRFVFFTVNSNVGAGSVEQTAIFRHDLLNDPIITATNWTNGSFVFVRTNLARLTNVLVCEGCANPSVSADGRLVAFEKAGTGGTTNVVVRDLQTGMAELISLYGNTPHSAHGPLMSFDGFHVVFTTTATGPYFDTNNASDIFVHDRRTRITHLVSRSSRRVGPATGPPPDTGNRLSAGPVISADGRRVAFHSYADDLVPGDYNDARDVFVLNLNGADTDRDGLGDDWELAYFNALSQSGTMDYDGDGMSNLDEFLAGTDPTNGGSVFQVLVLTLAVNWAAGEPGAKTTVIWSATPGESYRVQTKSSVEAPWEDVPGDVIAFTPSASKTFDTAFSPSQGFFRAVLVP